LIFALGSAAIAALSLAFLPLPIAIASATLGALMVAGAEVDARTFLLPDIVTLGAIVCGVAFAPFVGDDGAWSCLAGAVMRASATALVLLSLRLGYRRLRGREGLGFGDVKLAAAIGAWLPLELIPVCFALATTAALLTVLAGRRNQAIEEIKLPFGAFLCPALWLVFFVDALPS
jgi:leader peptidase (prepilin peptidase)/N-methyltransferase